VKSDQSTVISGGAGLSFLSKLFMRIYSRVARDPRLFAVSQRLAAAGTRLVSPFSQWVRLPAFTGWGYSKDFPRFAGQPFRARFHREDTRSAKAPDTKEEELRDHPLFAVEKDRVEQFITELTALGGHVIPTGDPTRGIIEFLKSRGVDHIHLEPNTLDESLLQEANINTTITPDPAIRVGVTKAICGLADTGSVLIVDGEGGPLHASLLPEVHLAVLRKSAILPSLENAMNLVRESNAAAFITGPSRTADIEMTLTIGVHGPGELHIFLVDG
jgi:L-lactate utilization protein LutC